MNTRLEGIDGDTLRGVERSRSVLVVILPVARLVAGLAALAVVVAAGLAGYRTAAGPEALDRLFTGTPALPGPERVVEIPETIVNLRRETPSQYLKIGISLVAAPGRAGTIEAAMPKLVDTVQEFLRNLDRDDLDGSAGLYRLRSELKRRFNLLLAPSGGGEVVTDVLLRSLLTQ